MLGTLVAVPIAPSRESELLCSSAAAGTSQDRQAAAPTAQDVNQTARVSSPRAQSPFRRRIRCKSGVAPPRCCSRFWRGKWRAESSDDRQSNALRDGAGRVLVFPDRRATAVPASTKEA